MKLIGFSFHTSSQPARWGNLWSKYGYYLVSQWSKLGKSKKNFTQRGNFIRLSSDLSYELACSNIDVKFHAKLLPHPRPYMYAVAI